LIQRVAVTEHPDLAVERLLEDLAPRLQGSDILKGDAILRAPFVMIGSVSAIAEEMLRRRDRWGFSRYTVRWSDFDQLVPVLRRLDDLGELAT
jgi:hypothetical protein